MMFTNDFKDTTGVIKLSDDSLEEVSAGTVYTHSRTVIHYSNNTFSGGSGITIIVSQNGTTYPTVNIPTGSGTIIFP